MYNLIIFKKIKIESNYIKINGIIEFKVKMGGKMSSFMKGVGGG